MTNLILNEANFWLGLEKKKYWIRNKIHLFPPHCILKMHPD